MEASFPFVETLLATGRTVVLQLNEKFSIRVVHNAPLLTEWRGNEDPLPASLRQLLEELLPLPQARTTWQQVGASTEVDEAGVALGTVALRPPHGGGPARFATLSLHRFATEAFPLALLLRDASAAEGLQQALLRTQQSLSAALASLRSTPQEMRRFLATATAAVAALRATLRTPARDHPSVLAKLARLAEGADLLATDARASGVDMIADASRQLGGLATGLAARAHLAGNDLLALAPLLDRLASCVGDCVRIEEQRLAAAAPVATGDADPVAEHAGAEWIQRAPRRWAALMRRQGAEIGKLVKLQVRDARLVPQQLRRDVDDLLQHLLRNAIEHGIETPEQRLAAGKPAAGEIGVSFEHRGAVLAMTVLDDGQGFDVARIGRAAVLSGLLTEESLLEFDPHEVVGLIFKPAFSTEKLAGEAGRGRGMNHVRRAMARLGGDIAVATRPGRYTRFVVQLPMQESTVTHTG